ncbi:hypothetical protein [Novosphingopyxis sp.]|uniref:hypothetical protein n=1 Tax=Novosphingopyxis sp. TaxID=2709690 RepID=UPI003B58CAA7
MNSLFRYDGTIVRRITTRLFASWKDFLAVGLLICFAIMFIADISTRLPSRYATILVVVFAGLSGLGVQAYASLRLRSLASDSPIARDALDGRTRLGFHMGAIMLGAAAAVTASLLIEQSAILVGLASFASVALVVHLVLHENVRSFGLALQEWLRQGVQINEWRGRMATGFGPMALLVILAVAFAPVETGARIAVATLTCTIYGMAATSHNAGAINFLRLSGDSYLATVRRFLLRPALILAALIAATLIARNLQLTALAASAAVLVFIYRALQIALLRLHGPRTSELLMIFILFFLITIAITVPPMIVPIVVALLIFLGVRANRVTWLLR